MSWFSKIIHKDESTFDLDFLLNIRNQAEKNNTEAQYKLAEVYFAVKDYKQAYVWLSVAIRESPKYHDGTMESLVDCTQKQNEHLGMLDYCIKKLSELDLKEQINAGLHVSELLFKFNTKITEMDAANYFISKKIVESHDIFFKVTEEFKKLNNKELPLQCKENAIFDLAFAMIAFHMQALENIFSVDQAQRINKWIIDLLRRLLGKYATDEVKQYVNENKYAWETLESGNDPLNAIPVRLIYNWCGEKVPTSKIGDQAYIDSFLIMLIQENIMNSTSWKLIKDNNEIIKGDILPIEYFD